MRERRTTAQQVTVAVITRNLVVEFINIAFGVTHGIKVNRIGPQRHIWDQVGTIGIV